MFGLSTETEFSGTFNNLDLTYFLSLSSKTFFSKMNKLDSDLDIVKRKKWINSINKWKTNFPFIIPSKELSIPFIIQQLSKKLSKSLNNYLITTGVLTDFMYDMFMSLQTH
jgi:hypothetical protein